MDIFNFNIPRFISEVEKRPAIWDTEDEDYGNRERKKECWDELVELYSLEENLSNEKRLEIETKLQRRWKSLRDCFSRELNRYKRNSKNVNIPERRSQYVHFNQLQFLKRVSQCKIDSRQEDNTQNIEKNSDNSMDFCIEPLYVSVDSGQPSSPLPDHFQKKKKLKTLKTLKVDLESGNRTCDEREIILSPILDFESHEKNREKNEEDRMFLMSLVSSLNKIPENFKLRTKMEILRIIQNAQDPAGLRNQNNFETNLQRYPENSTSSWPVYVPVQGSLKNSFLSDFECASVKLEVDEISDI